MTTTNTTAPVQSTAPVVVAAPVGVAAIKDSDIEHAATLDDVDAAALYLQQIAGITDGGVAGQCLPDGDEWRGFSAEGRVRLIQHWLRVERGYEDGGEYQPKPPVVVAQSMSWHDAERELEVGDVLRTTDVLEAYPAYWLAPGARLVVVCNALNEAYAGHQHLAARLVPADEHLLSLFSDISEWGNQLMLNPPDAEDDGVDSWVRYPLPVVVDNDALPVVERIAAVFTASLEHEIGQAAMVDVVAENPRSSDPQVCASHAFCDANMVMLDAFERVGEDSPVSPGAEDSEAACCLWNEAWSLAKAQYFPVYGTLTADTVKAPVVSLANVGTMTCAEALQNAIDTLRGLQQDDHRDRVVAVLRAMRDQRGCGANEDMRLTDICDEAIFG